MRVAYLFLLSSCLVGWQSIISEAQAQYRSAVADEAASDPNAEADEMPEDDGTNEDNGEPPRPIHPPLGASVASDTAMLLRASIKASKLMFAAGHKFYRLNPSWGQFNPPAKWPYITLMTGKIKAGASASPATALRNCRCVVVDMVAYRQWLLRLVGESNFKDFKDEPENILVFMLLHEVGHIKNGDAVGRFDSFLDQLSNERNLDKDRELAADGFAGSTILSSNGWYVTRRPDFSSASAVEFALNELKFKIDVDIASPDFARIFSKFNGDPEYYWDKSSSHPSIRLRILSILAMARPETYLKDLDEFERMREDIDPNVFSIKKELYERSFQPPPYPVPNEDFLAIPGFTRGLQLVDKKEDPPPLFKGVESGAIQVGAPLRAR